MPLTIKKREFFTNSINLGEPIGINHISFLALDTDFYLNQLTADGDLIKQFTDEAQKFDFRYGITFDSQYAYNFTGNVSGKVALPQGENPLDYEVDVFTFTDVLYFMETVPIGQNFTWTTIAGTANGSKVAQLVARENTLVVAGGGNVTNRGVTIAETYVFNPPNGRRLPRSYNVDPRHTAFSALRYRSYCYDTAMYVCAMISLNEQTRAQENLTALLKTQQRSQLDDAGLPTGQGNTDRIPFSSNLLNPQILLDAYHRTGSEMFVAYALLHFANAYPLNAQTTTFKSRAQDLLVALYNQEYVYSTGLQDGIFRGGKGQYTLTHDEENNQLVYTNFDPSYVVPWGANEHNTDAYFVFKLANILSYTKDFNILRKTLNSGTAQSAGKNNVGAIGGSCFVQHTMVDGGDSFGLGVIAAETGLSRANVLGEAGCVVNGTNLDWYENGILTTASITPWVKGDVIVIERRASDNKFRLYKNSTLIVTSTFVSAGLALNANFRVVGLHSFAKIQTAQTLFSAYSYVRTYPIRSFTAIHADFSQDITDVIRASVQSALVAPTKFWEDTENRGRRGISSDTVLDACHALDNMTWMSMALRNMGETAKANEALDYVLNGNNGSYSTYDTFYSARSFKPYIPNNGCYASPVTTALTWTEGAAGYIMALAAKDGPLNATVISSWKEIAKIARVDGIPYVTKADNFYELQDWGCLISACWAVVSNKPAGFWEHTYSQIVS